MDKIKLLIADDENLISKLLQQHLNGQDNIEVTCLVKNGNQALDELETRTVDIVLLDVNMPEMDGLHALEIISQRYPDIKVIMLSSFTNPVNIQKALDMGASGYLSKNINSEEIVNAVNTVMHGGCYLCRTSMDKITKKEKTTDEQQNASVFDRHLTKREKEILSLVAMGCSNDEIAKRLCLSKRTIETHRRNMLHKFGEKNFIGLMKTVMELNLIQLPDLYHSS